MSYAAGQMSEPIVRASADRGGTGSLFAPLALWLGVQLCALLLGAMQVRFSEGFIRPPEHAAMTEMLIAQIGGAAMLLAFLFRRWEQVVVLPCLTLPCTQLAGVLSATGAAKVGWVAVYTCLWVLMAGMWGLMVRSRTVGSSSARF